MYNNTLIPGAVSLNHFCELYHLLTESPKIIDRHKLKLQEGNSISVNHFIAGRAGLQMALPVQRTELHVSAEIHHFN